MLQPRVSVIVPVFEVEPYIEECLDSIANQTLENIEVILVLKQGRDKSCEMASYYAKKYDWLVAHVSPEERQGESRNIGIEMAKGEFIVFADSDDIVPEKAYEKMVEALDKTGADLCLGRTLRFHSKKPHGWRIKNFERGGIFEGRRVLGWEEWPDLALNGGPWNKMIKLSYLKENNIKFPEGLLYEDVGFSMALYAENPSIVIEPTVVYKWRVRLAGQASITQQRDDLSNLTDRLAVYKIVDENLSQKNISDALKKVWQFRKVNDLLYYIENYFSGTDYYRDEFQRLVPPYLNDIPLEVFKSLTGIHKKYALLLRQGAFDRVDKVGKRRALAKTVFNSIKKSRPSRGGLFKRILGYLSFPVRAVKNTKSDLLRLAKRRRWVYDWHPRNGISYKILRYFVKPTENCFLYEGVSGRQYAGNEKYIYLELKKRYPSAKHVWVFQDKDAVQRNLEYLKGDILVIRNSFKYLYYLSKAKALFTGTSLPYYYKKQKDSFFIQTWHGTPVKLLGFDIKHLNAKSLNLNSTENVMYSQSKLWDYFVAPNEFTAEKFSSAYLYKGEILRAGYPRNDIFFWADEKKAEIVRSVREKLGIPAGKKIALYAPTFRDGTKFGTRNTSVTFPLDFDVLKSNLSEEWVLIVRAHLLSGGKFDSSRYEPFVITAMVDEYDDPQELCLAADVLITDYSSIAFDYANTKKPILLFTPDIEEYANSRRGFYFDPRDQFPGPFLTDSLQVAEALMCIDKMAKSYVKKYDEFYSNYCAWEDGNASGRVAEAVIGRIGLN